MPPSAYSTRGAAKVILLYFIAQKKHDYAQTAKGADLKIGNRFDYLKVIEERILDNHSFEESIPYIADTMQCTG